MLEYLHNVHNVCVCVCDKCPRVGTSSTAFRYPQYPAGTAGFSAEPRLVRESAISRPKGKMQCYRTAFGGGGDPMFV